MRVDILVKTEKQAVVLEALPGSKIRLNAATWVELKVIIDDQALEARIAGGQLSWARKDRLRGPKAIRSACHKTMSVMSNAKPLSLTLSLCADITCGRYA